MSGRLTIRELEQLQKEGKIRGFVDKKSVDKNCQQPKAGRSKYGAQKVTFDGIEFDSIKEGNRYLHLRMLRNAGYIRTLSLQVPFELNDGGTHSLKYIADFLYFRNGVLVVEDAKGFRTKEYKKKRKLMKEVYNIEIKEV